MKKSIIVIFTSITLVTFVSCEKDYTCHCVLKDKWGKQVNSLTDRGTFTESDAKTWCKGKEDASGLGFTYTCTLH